MDAITRQFERFDKENPNVWTAFEYRALALAEKGVKRAYTIHIFSELRELLKFRLNNDFTCLYARKFLAKHRKYVG